jgi:hypothetical protein
MFLRFMLILSFWLDSGRLSTVIAESPTRLHYSIEYDWGATMHSFITPDEQHWVDWTKVSVDTLGWRALASD